ncbi:MAG: peptidoglycan-binding protein, partial [Pseudomonadota bacterium]|nr:peptidoglycan-binding protein [Pseudomonadota bacterium]
MKLKKLLLAAGCCLALSLSGPAWSGTSEKEIQSNLDGLLWNFPAEMLSLQWNEVPVTEIDQKLANVYRERESRPLWVTADGPGKKAEALLYLLRTADNEALDPADYPVSVIDQLWDQRSPDALALLDIALTSGLVAYANDLSHGRLRVREEDPQLFSAAHGVEFEPKLIVNQALAAPNLETYLQGLAPSYPQYHKLRAALKQYRQIAGEGGWPLVADGPTLHPGEEGARVSDLRERLLISGDLAGAGAVSESMLYGESLVAAVKQFQQRHGLAADGVIGPGTLAELN